MADTYLNIKGKLLRLIDNGDGTHSVSVSPNNTEYDLLSGVATGGSTNTLTDDTKNFEADGLNGRLIRLMLDGVEYIRLIASSTGNQIGFNDTVPNVGAIAVVGSGEDAEGNVSVHCKGDLLGVIGNDYSIQIVQGEGTSGENFVALDEANKILLVTVDLNGLGETRNLGASDLQVLINNAADISDKFNIPDGFTAGNLPIGGDPIPFAGGIDGVSVVAGTEYKVI